MIFLYEIWGYFQLLQHQSFPKMFVNQVQQNNFPLMKVIIIWFSYPGKLQVNYFYFNINIVKFSKVKCITKCFVIGFWSRRLSEECFLNTLNFLSNCILNIRQQRYIIFAIASVLKIHILSSNERFLEFHKRRTFCIFLIMTKYFFVFELLYCKKNVHLISSLYQQLNQLISTQRLPL